MAGLTSTLVLIMGPSPKPVGRPDLGRPASKPKKLHFFAKPAGFRFFNTENYIHLSMDGKCASGNQANPEKVAVQTKSKFSCLSTKAAYLTGSLGAGESSSGSPPGTLHRTHNTAHMSKSQRQSSGVRDKGGGRGGAAPSTLPWDYPGSRRRHVESLENKIEIPRSDF